MVVLFKNCVKTIFLFYSGNEEHIYVVCMSSISKNFSWKDITFLIEYQTDKNVCWKSLCKKEKIFHFHITFDSLPLKTLDDIKHLPALKGKLYLYMFY